MMTYSRFGRLLLAPSLAVLLAFVLMAVALERASATHVEAVEDAIAAAIALYAEDPAQAKADLYALATDADIPEACAQWADVNLAAIVVIEGGVDFPDSWALRPLFDFTLKAIPVFRNDCLLAL